MRSLTGDLTHDLDPNSSDVAGMQYPPGLDAGDDSLDPSGLKHRRDTVDDLHWLMLLIR